MRDRRGQPRPGLPGRRTARREVVEVAVDALRGGRNQYAPRAGVPELREAIAGTRNGSTVRRRPRLEVGVTTGCDRGDRRGALGLVDPGDEVIVLEPYYDSYVAVIQMAGARTPPGDAASARLPADLDELRPRCRRAPRRCCSTPRTTRPAPCSRARRAEAVADVAIEHDLVVITDEVYEHLTFDGVPHVPIATLPGMAERTLTISSAGKTFSFTGWKVGWATGPGRAGRRGDGGQAVPDLHLRLAAAAGGRHALERRTRTSTDLARDLQAQRDLLCAGLPRPGSRSSCPQGTYFATADVAPSAGRRRRVLPRAAGARRRRRDPDPGVLRRPGRPRGHPAPGALRVLQVPHPVIEDGVTRLAKADLTA